MTLEHDGRHGSDLRLVSIADAEARGIEAVRQDREAYDLPPGTPAPRRFRGPSCSARPRRCCWTCRS
jgi:hypothetical protein